jgi:hypothetical protein
LYQPLAFSGTIKEHPVMNFGAVRTFPLVFAILMFLSLSMRPAQAQTDGIFADFNTSMGSFTCRLHYQDAPKAVAG